MGRHQFSGKRAYLGEFVERKTLTDKGFSSSMGSLNNLHISIILYAYYTLDGTTIILVQNNTIYSGDMMKYYLANPLQSEENGIHIDIRPKKYYPDEYVSHTVTLLDGPIIPLLYDGILPYIYGRRLTTEEI